MAVLVSGNEIVLSGTVGSLFWDDSFDAADVIMALAHVGRDQDVTIRLNSGGGIATEGAAIHAALCAHKGRKTIIVEGVAASAASVIAMAGDEIVMALGAIMMIHDPSGCTFGTIADHEVQIRAMTSLASAMAGIYSDRSGKTVDEARADMKAEIWMSPPEAVAAGYADRVQGRIGKSVASSETEVIDVDDEDDEGDEEGDVGIEPTAFDFRLYQHPPERLVALVDQHAWSKRTRHLAALPAAPNRRTESPMASAPAGSNPASKPKSTPPTQEQPATAISRADAAEIATLCVDGGVPAMTAALIAEGVTPAVAKTRVAAAGQIKEIVALARRTNPRIPENQADEFLAQGKTVDQARAALFDQIVAKEAATETRSHVEVQTSAHKPDATASRANMERQLKAQGFKKDA